MTAILLLIIQLQNGVLHSDWIAGPGYQGPWGVPVNGFWQEEQIEWFETPDNLILEAPTYRYTIADSFFGGDASIVSADINSDSYADLFYGTWNPAGVGWFENPGVGDEWIQHQISAQAASHVDVGDPDGDGDPDLLVASGHTDVLAWFENTGGSWIRHDLSPVSLHPMRLCSADMDGDGDEDIVSFSTDETVSWYENDTGYGTTWTHHPVWTFSTDAGLRWLEVANLDGDASPELVAALHDACDIVYLDMVTGPDDWQLLGIDYHTAGWEWDCVDAADIDCDGDQDVVATRIKSSRNYIYWFENGNSWNRTTAVSEYFYDTDYIRLADLDGNGRPDILMSGDKQDAWLQTGEPDVGWYMRRGPLVSAGSGSCVAAGDFDSDGIDELAAVMSSAVNGSVEWCDYTVSGYPATGQLTTSIFQVPIGCCAYEVVWENMIWEAYEPDGTQIGFLVRASSDYNYMGEWSDTIWVNGTYLDPLLPLDGVYAQCQAILATSDPDVTPVLRWFCAEGYVPGDLEGSSTEENLTFSTASNPSEGFFSLQITLPQDTSVQLTIHDLAGRVVISEDLGELAKGFTSYLSPALSPGIYFARLTAAGEERILRLAVIP